MKDWNELQETKIKNLKEELAKSNSVNNKLFIALLVLFAVLCFDIAFTMKAHQEYKYENQELEAKLNMTREKLAKYEDSTKK